MTTKPSEDPIFLNSRSRQAVIAVSTFLDANAPDNQALPPSPPPRYVGAESDAGFDIDTTDLTIGIHMRLATVSITLTSLPKLQKHTSLLWIVVRNREENNSEFQNDQRITMVPMSVTLSRNTLSTFSLLTGLHLVLSQLVHPTIHNWHSLNRWIDSFLLPCGGMRLRYP